MRDFCFRVSNWPKIGFRWMNHLKLCSYTAQHSFSIWLSKVVDVNEARCFWLNFHSTLSISFHNSKHIFCSSLSGIHQYGFCMTLVHVFHLALKTYLSVWVEFCMQTIITKIYLAKDEMSLRYEWHKQLMTSRLFLLNVGAVAIIINTIANKTKFKWVSSVSGWLTSPSYRTEGKTQIPSNI